MSNAVISWAKENPVAAGAAAIGVIVVVMLFSGGGSSGSSGADTGAGVAAYYAAVSNQAQAGAAIQTAQITANAQTNQTLIAATYGLETAKVNANSANYAVEQQSKVATQYITAMQDVQNNATASNERLIADSHKVAMASLGTKALSGAQKTAVLQTGLTGQVAPVSFAPINPGNSTSAVISSIGGLIGSIGGAVGSIFG